MSGIRDRRRLEANYIYWMSIGPVCSYGRLDKSREGTPQSPSAQ